MLNSGSQDIRNPQIKSIRQRIVSLVVLIVLPLLGLISWVAVKYASAERRLLEQQRLEITNAISAEIDIEVTKWLSLLTGLSVSNELLAGDAGNFKQQADKLIGQNQVARMWAFDSTGDTVEGTMTPAGGEPIGGVLVDLKSKVFNDRNHAISSVLLKKSGRPAVVIATPAFQDQKVAYGVAAEIDLTSFGDAFADLHSKPGWVAAVVDRNGRFVARSLDPANRVGGFARPELIEVAQGAEQGGVFENVTFEGARMINAYRRSKLTGWTTVVAVPKAELNAPFSRAIALLTIGGLSLLAATIGLASIMSQRISQPVRDLSRFAHALAGGPKFEPSRHHIKELDEVRAALESAMAEGARLSAIVASSGDAIMSIDLAGNVLTWNKGAQDLFGYSPEEIIGRPKTLVIPEDRLVEFEQQRKAILEGGTARTETVRKKRDGTRVQVSIDSAPIRGHDGQILAISSIIHDISERKAADGHQRFLMRELAHRSKNQLAIIQAVANQTARSTSSIDEFLTMFRKRLQALSVSHDLLSARDWKGATLSEVVARQIEVFEDRTKHNVEISGPEIAVSSAAAESIGLALHELATNSTKYGALSVPTGRVKIVWSLVANGSEAQNLRLIWEESGGPQVVAPKRKGFGTHVIERMVSAAVSGKVQLDYRPEGLRWQLEYPAVT